MVEKNHFKAVILLAHGTKELEASEPVHQYAKALAKSTGQRVEPCLREFIEPSVPTVVEKLVKEGVQKIYVVPFFLFNSGHVTRDIQNEIEAEKRKYPEVQFKIGNPLGFDNFLTQLLSKRMNELLKQ